MAKTPRELAYRTLLSSERDHSRSIDEFLSDQLASSQLSAQEKAWIMELVFGITRMRLQLDTWIQTVYKGRYHKAQYAIKVLLRMGVFQLKFMETAEHAAINESVELAKKVGQKNSSNLVNAILRQVQRMELDQVLEHITDQIERTSVISSHPEWLLKRWYSRYTQDEVLALCRHNNTSPVTWIRRNIQQIDSDGFEKYLDQHQIVFEQSQLLENFYRIDSAGPLLTTQEFQAGYFSFQDQAAGLVASLIDPQAGETILDACAAPGGKMAFISEQSMGKAKLIACDASQTRLRKVQQTVERLKLEQVTILQLDAVADKLPDADKILLDVPCSGTGVLNRRPDARWRKQENDIIALALIQKRILQNSWNSLQVGGVLVYATCSLESEENWEIIDAVLPDLGNAEIVRPEAEKLKPYIDERGALATLPWRDGMDGMFAVIIRKMS